MDTWGVQLVCWSRGVLFQSAYISHAVFTPAAGNEAQMPCDRLPQTRSDIKGYVNYLHF